MDSIDRRAASSRVARANTATTDSSAEGYKNNNAAQQGKKMTRLGTQSPGNAKPVLILSAIAAAISACYSPGVFAQDGHNLVLDEVVVTGRRREEKEQIVPIAMKAMDEEFLRTQNIGQIQDIGTKVPSLRISGASGSLNEPLISLRGQRPAETIFSQDPAVPLYFNEVAISPTQGSNLGLYDLEGLEVLKGPQGTLFGRNSTGGAVLMTPKRPGSNLGGYMEAKVGDYDLYGFEGAVDVPVTDGLQMRLAGHKLDRDGYQKNIADNALNGKRYHDEHSEGARLSINFDADRLSNLIVLAYDENDIASAIPSTTGNNRSTGLGLATNANPAWAAWQQGVQRNIERDNPWKVESDIDSEELVRNVFASNTTEFRVTDDLSVKNILGYRKVGFETTSDIDGTAFPGWGAWTSGAPGVTFDPRPTTTDSELFSEELQLVGSAFDQRLVWITGVNWSRLDARQDYLVQTSPGPSYDSGITDAVNTSYGIFGEGTYTFTDQWSFTLGLRQSWDERELTVSKWTDVARTACDVRGPDDALLTTSCSRSVDENFDSPTWRMSVNYTSVDNHLMYGSISTGYRAGGFNTRGKDNATLRPFDEETVTTYELGHKADWHVDWAAIRTRAALYFQAYENIHHTRSFAQPNGALVTTTENAAKAEISGLEFDVTLLSAQGLELNLSYSYVDAEYKKKEDLINGVEVDTSGNDFSYIPKQSATASATYTLPFDATLGDMSLTASLYWQDDMTTHQLIDQFPIMVGRAGLWSPEDVARMTDFSNVDSYEVWNARFDWRNVMESNFDAAVYVDNVTDEQYVLGGLNVVDSGGYGSYFYGAPRTIGGSVRYTF